MRILKYIFLLVLLALVGVAVFVSTQKSEYDITVTRVIKSPRSVVYTYVSEVKNWENFMAWAKGDASARFSYAATTSGTGGAFSWKSSDGEGSIRTLFAKDNDSLYQKMTFNGAPSQISWKFEDAANGTKVTWRAKGKTNFWFKIQSIAKGGLDKMLSAINEQSLANLDKTLVYEVNSYSVSENGIVYKSASKFLKYTILSSIDNAPKNTRIMLSKMFFFFGKNRIPMYGKPFVLYHSYDTAKGLTQISVCIPIKDEIRTAEGSDITFGEFKTMKAVKVTLNGDYSHRAEAWQRASEYISKAKLERDANIRVIEVLAKNIEDTKSPSKWVTQIYFPLRSVIAEPAKPQPVRRVETPKKPAEQDTDEFTVQ